MSSIVNLFLMESSRCSNQSIFWENNIEDTIVVSWFKIVDLFDADWRDHNIVLGGVPYEDDNDYDGEQQKQKE